MAGKKPDNEDTRDVFEKALDAESAERKRRNSFDNSPQQVALRDKEREERVDVLLRMLAGTAAGYAAPVVLRKVSKRYKKFTDPDPQVTKFGEEFHDTLKGVGAIGGGLGAYASAERPVSRGRFERQKRNK